MSCAAGIRELCSLLVAIQVHFYGLGNSRSIDEERKRQKKDEGGGVAGGSGELKIRTTSAGSRRYNDS